MKKHVHPKLKKLIKDSLKRHAWNLGCTEYMGDILYMSEPHENTATLATMTVSRRYLKATLRVFPLLIKEWEERNKSGEDGDAHVENTIAHEVAHIITQPLFDIAIATYRNEGEMSDAWESLTERIGRLSVALDKELRKK
jgi:hypothetical protein